jgi:hypothetical protein
LVSKNVSNDDLIFTVGAFCIGVGFIFATLFTTIIDYKKPVFEYEKDKYNCTGILDCNKHATWSTDNGALNIVWDLQKIIDDPSKIIPRDSDASFITKRLGGIQILNIFDIMENHGIFKGGIYKGSSSLMQRYNAAGNLKNAYVIFIKNISMFASLYDASAIQIVLIWRDINQADTVKKSDLLVIKGDVFEAYNHTNFKVVGNFIPLSQTGGSRRGTKKSPKKSGKVAHWVSTGERVTLPDGKVRTLYRNERTDKVGVRKMVKRAGKKVAVYKLFKR